MAIRGAAHKRQTPLAPQLTQARGTSGSHKRPRGAPGAARGCKRERRAWGVWTSHSSARSSVRTTSPSPRTSLIVGFTRTPSTAAPTCAAPQAGRVGDPFLPPLVRFRCEPASGPSQPLAPRKAAYGRSALVRGAPVRCTHLERVEQAPAHVGLLHERPRRVVDGHQLRSRPDRLRRHGFCAPLPRLERLTRQNCTLPNPLLGFLAKWSKAWSNAGRVRSLAGRALHREHFQSTSHTCLSGVVYVRATVCLQATLCIQVMKVQT